MAANRSVWEEKVKDERNNPYVAVRLNDIGKEVIFE